MTDKQDALVGGELIIPKWFAVITTGVVALAVPWAGWVTITLATINVKIENQTELRHKSDVLSTRFNANSQDIQIIIERMLADDEREVRDAATFAECLRRISALEQKLGSD